MRFKRKAYVCLMTLLCLLSFAGAPPASAVDDCETLRALGISGLLDGFPEEPLLKQTFRLDASKLMLEHAGEYVILTMDGMDGVIAEPGKPSLPYKSLVFELPRNVEVTDVGVVNVSYGTIYTFKKIKPAPQPLPYMPNYRQFTNLTEILKEDPEVYGSSKFYPGSLINYHVGRRMKKHTFSSGSIPYSTVPEGSSCWWSLRPTWLLPINTLMLLAGRCRRLQHSRVSVVQST